MKFKKKKEAKPCDLNYVSEPWNMYCIFMYINSVASSVTLLNAASSIIVHQMDNSAYTIRPTKISI